MVSLPSPPSSTSSYAEPTRVSLPVPPFSVSATRFAVVPAAVSVSFPPAPSTTSWSPSPRTPWPTSTRYDAAPVRATRVTGTITRSLLRTVVLVSVKVSVPAPPSTTTVSAARSSEYRTSGTSML